jgi:hypothetical protein
MRLSAALSALGMAAAQHTSDWTAAECRRSIVRVLGVGFSAAAPGRDTIIQDSMFMVTELCSGGTLRDKVLSQMAAGRKVGRPGQSNKPDVCDADSTVRTDAGDILAQTRTASMQQLGAC